MLHRMGYERWTRHGANIGLGTGHESTFLSAVTVNLLSSYPGLAQTSLCQMLCKHFTMREVIMEMIYHNENN